MHFPNRNNFSRSCAYLYDLIWPLGQNCEACNWLKYLSLLPGWDSQRRGVCEREAIEEKKIATKLSSEDTEQIQGVEYDTVGQYYERLFPCHI